MIEKQCVKFDELKIDINNVKNKCVSQCNELKRDMEKVVESVEKQIKSKSNQIVDTTVSNSGNMTTNSEEINDKVCTDDYNEMLTSNNNDIKNGDVIENGVSKSDTVDNSSNIERRKLVDVSKKVVISIDELEKEWRDSLNAEYKKRANFSCSIYEVNASQVLYEDKGSLLVYLGDKRSANNSPFMYYGFPGKARMCCNNVVLPSVWNERVKRGWERYEEREREW